MARKYYKWPLVNKELEGFMPFKPVFSEAVFLFAR